MGGTRTRTSTQPVPTNNPEDRNKLKSRKATVETEEEESEDEIEAPPPAKKEKYVRVVTSKDNDDVLKDLPFINVPAMPSVARPIITDRPGTMEAVPINGKHVPAYKNKAPIEKDMGRELEVISKILDTPIMVTAEDLLTVSKPLRDELRKLVTKKRVANRSKAAEVDSMLSELAEELETETAAEGDLQLRSDAKNVDELPKAAFVITTQATTRVPKGATVILDPVEQYLNSLPEGEQPKQIFVAKESDQLRTIYPRINAIKEEECVLDGGSQIVSMDRNVAEELGIPWDPDIRIHMQSANKSLELSCGLARDVPFLFGGITLFLQVHIIKGPAYRVLLGRPFDTLTESEVHNKRDGGQVITLTDPNSGNRVTIPTYTRGATPRIERKIKEQDFHRLSRN